MNWTGAVFGVVATVICVVTVDAEQATRSSWQLAQVREIAQLRKKTKTSEIKKKLNRIYLTLSSTAAYESIVSDLQVRNFHYARPHTRMHRLCPECTDVFGKNLGEVLFIPETRFDELIELERAHNGVRRVVKRAAQEEDEPLDVLAELEAVLFLLRAHKTIIFGLMTTAEFEYHYAKKHDHPQPGGVGFGRCPECIKLRKRQTTPTRAIHRKRYAQLLALEKSVGAK